METITDDQRERAHSTGDGGAAVIFSAHVGGAGGDGVRQPLLLAFVILLIWLPTTTCSDCGGSSVPTTESPQATSAPTSVESTTPSTPPTSVEPVQPVGCAGYTENATLPLGLCDSGLEVTDLQFRLSEILDGVEIDGFFGPATEAAVRDFQAEYGLPVTGTVDQATIDTLVTATGTAMSGPPAETAGITLNGRQQNIIYECRTVPFPIRDGQFAQGDGELVIDQYLVEDPIDGRSVVELWQEGESLTLVVRSLWNPVFGSIDMEYERPIVATVPTEYGPVDVTADFSEPANSCDVMTLESASGAIDFGVADVCTDNLPQGERYTVTFNSSADGSRLGPTVLSVWVNDDGVDVGAGTPSLYVGGTLNELGNATWLTEPSGARMIGDYSVDGEVYTLDLTLSPLPSGGNECPVSVVD